MKDRIKGKGEEIKGRVTGDTTEELKGKARQKLGKGEQKIDRKADEAETNKRDR
ncbi:MAG: CsbD family protein [Candidatus Dormiibacterota bacterium]